MTSKENTLRPIPTTNAQTGRLALKQMFKKRYFLAGLEALHAGLGDIFLLSLPGFEAIMLAGPEANRFVLTSERDAFLWRTEGDPVTKLLRHGVLVLDGEEHDEMRRKIMPSLHKQMLSSYVEGMWQSVDQVSASWTDGGTINLLDEMRKIALLILTRALFKEDFTPYLQSHWDAVIQSIKYISPGLWLIWRDVPRPMYKRPLAQMDHYLYQMIEFRSKNLGETDDLLGALIQSGMNADDIRDQLLTMLIAGHDTSTALLTWTLYLLSVHPETMQACLDEIETHIGDREPTLEDMNLLECLERVINESTRLYPPIHLGSRKTARDIVYQDYLLPADTRVMYSIYLTHRHPDYWDRPTEFDPDRFLPENSQGRVPYSFLPFGGGPRNCIGMAFAKLESKLVLARLLQKFTFAYVGGNPRPKMGATLEPHKVILSTTFRRD